jgi:hypothetical protein
MAKKRHPLNELMDAYKVHTGKTSAEVKADLLNRFNVGPSKESAKTPKAARDADHKTARKTIEFKVITVEDIGEDGEPLIGYECKHTHKTEKHALACLRKILAKTQTYSFWDCPEYLRQFVLNGRVALYEVEPTESGTVCQTYLGYRRSLDEVIEDKRENNNG